MVVATAVGVGVCALPALAQPKSPSPIEGVPRLLIWIAADKGYQGLEKVAAAFAREAGIVATVQHPEGLTDKFQSAASAGKGPDIVCWAHDRVGEWAQGGLIVPVQPSRRLRADIDDMAWQAFSWRGQTWGYPLAIEAIGLVYNKALAPVPPASFDDVTALHQRLTPHGRKAILWAYNNSYFTWPMLAGPGGYVFGRDAAGQLDTRSVGVNHAGAVRGLSLLERLVREGYMPRGARYPDMETAFARGQVAAMITGPWAWDNARKAGIDFGVAPLPAVDGHPSKPFVGVLGCMITAPSRIKDIAREFIEQHLLTLPALRTINSDTPLGTPAHKAFFRELSADARIAATMANARAGEPIPNVPEMGRFFSAMEAALEAVTNGRQSPKDALDAAAARMLAR